MATTAKARNRAKQKRLSAEATNTSAYDSNESAANEEKIDSSKTAVDKSTDSSSSSSDSDGSLRTTGGDWKINLANFSKTQTNLEAVINNSHKCREIATAYCDKVNKNVMCLPWEGGRSEYGINPLHRFLYTTCEANDELAVRTISPSQFVKLTDAGLAITRELQDDNYEYYSNNRYTYGDSKGSCIGTYMEILHHPIKAFNAFRRYWDVNRKRIKAVAKTDVKKMLKKCKRWLRANHRIWFTIVNRLSTEATDICASLETSNGLMLPHTIKKRFGNAHAQCLGALLAELTTVQPMTLATGKTESVQQYMDRVQRIARDASTFPAMRFPVPMPLVKVFALQGLLKHDVAKYTNTAYANDLEDSMERLTSNMQTVEGLRAEKIRREYGHATNLATASIETAKTAPNTKSKIGAGPNDLCNLKGHFGHTNANCSMQKLRKLRQNGRAKPVMYDSNGSKICEFVTNSLRCPFKNCRFSHKFRGMRSSTHTPRRRTSERGRERRNYHATTFDDSSTDSDSKHSTRSKHSKKHRRSHKKHERKHKRKHKRKERAYAFRATSDSSSSSSSESSYFMQWGPHPLTKGKLKTK